jgi:type IV pilus assembly protein PilA
MLGCRASPFFRQEGAMTHRRSRLTTSDGFTLIEVLVVASIISVLAAVATVSMLRAKISANEASAVSSLRAINTAQGTYSASAASGGFAVELTVLATPCPGSTSAFISPDLAVDPAKKSGYAVTLAAGTSSPGPNDCNGTASRSGYYLTAAPEAVGASGSRAFATTHRFVLYTDGSGVPPTEAAMAPGGTAQVLQ